LKWGDVLWNEKTAEELAAMSNKELSDHLLALSEEHYYAGYCLYDVVMIEAASRLTNRQGKDQQRRPGDDRG
jgi:hypothetical protein